MKQSAICPLLLMDSFWKSRINHRRREYLLHRSAADFFYSVIVLTFFDFLSLLYLISTAYILIIILWCPQEQFWHYFATSRQLAQKKAAMPSICNKLTSNIYSSVAISELSPTKQPFAIRYLWRCWIAWSGSKLPMPACLVPLCLWTPCFLVRGRKYLKLRPARTWMFAR